MVRGRYTCDATAWERREGVGSCVETVEAGLKQTALTVNCGLSSTLKKVIEGRSALLNS